MDGGFEAFFVFLLQVLNVITEEVLMFDGSFKSVTDQCDYIKQALSSDKGLRQTIITPHPNFIRTPYM